MYRPTAADTAVRDVLHRILGEVGQGSVDMPMRLARDAAQALTAGAAALMTIAEVAAALGCCDRTVHRMIAEHGIPVVRFGKRSTLIPREGPDHPRLGRSRARAWLAVKIRTLVRVDNHRFCRWRAVPCPAFRHRT